MGKLLSVAALSAAAALGSISPVGVSVSNGVLTFSVAEATAKTQPAQPNKPKPADTKAARLGGGPYGRPKNPRGKPVRHSVAQDRRVASKKRNVKRHRARS